MELNEALDQLEQRCVHLAAVLRDRHIDSFVWQCAVDNAINDVHDAISIACSVAPSHPKDKP